LILNAEGDLRTGVPQQGELNTRPLVVSRWPACSPSRAARRNAEIYTLGDDGTLTRLTRNDAIDTSPSWSPTGREISFTSDRSGSPQIYLMDAEGGTCAA